MTTAMENAKKNMINTSRKRGIREHSRALGVKCIFRQFGLLISSVISSSY
jgi:hypothetical protein